MATKSTTSRTTNDAAVRGASSNDRVMKQPITRKDCLRTLLLREGGASLDALQKEFGWQPHTVRAAISGIRKAGDKVLRESGKSGPVYRIVEASAAP